MINECQSDASALSKVQPCSLVQVRYELRTPTVPLGQRKGEQGLGREGRGDPGMHGRAAALAGR